MIILLLACLSLASAEPFETLYSWNQIEYNFPNESVRNNYLESGDYIPVNNLPMGINIWNDRMFVTVSRWKKGVASTLNYFWMNDSNPSPALTPYPNWESNDIHLKDSLVSIFRIRIDACGRLWGLDTGVDDILGDSKVVQPMKLVVFDLKTDKLLRSYTLKDTDKKASTFVAELAVDVDPNSCDDAYAYLTDFGGYGIIVYSWNKNDSWRLEHNYFHFDPLHCDYTVSGINFQWTDGVFGLALSPVQEDGYKTVYFHAMSGVTEFAVSTKLLKNETMAKTFKYHDFQIVGNKGSGTQGSTSMIDPDTNINYFVQVNRNGIACWDTTEKLSPETFELASQDNETMVFPNDLLVHSPSKSLLVISNNLPKFAYGSLDPKGKNYFITAAPLNELTKICKASA